MTDEQNKVAESQPAPAVDKLERFPELAELEEKIQRRLRSNQRFLERFMDEDFDDLDDDDLGEDGPGGDGEEDQEPMEEL